MSGANFRKGLVTVNCIQYKTWDCSNLQYWHAQNSLLFIKKKCLDDSYLLLVEYVKIKDFPISIVHPKKYLETYHDFERISKVLEWYKYRSEPKNWPLREVIQAMPEVVINGIKRTLGIK